MDFFVKDNIKVIEMDLSTVCNAKCPLCMRQTEYFRHTYNMPFFRSADQILEQLMEYKNLRDVYLIGQMSEPTLHPDFLDIVYFLKQKHFNLKICTNGSTKDWMFWRNLGKMLSENDRVWFAVCGSTQEIHSRYRIGTNLAQILDNAKVLRQEKRIDGIKCIRFKYNEQDFKSREFKNIVEQFSFVEYTETCVQENMEISDEFKPCDAVKTEYDKIYALSDMFNKIYPGNSCQSIAEHYIQIDPFGNIFPCYRFLEMAGQQWDGDYKKITDGTYSCCKFCNEKLNDFIKRKGLHFII